MYPHDTLENNYKTTQEKLHSLAIMNWHQRDKKGRNWHGIKSKNLSPCMPQVKGYFRNHLVNLTANLTVICRWSK